MLDKKWVKIVLLIIGCIVVWKLLEFIFSLITGAAFALLSLSLLLIPIAIGIGIGYLLFFRKK